MRYEYLESGTGMFLMSCPLDERYCRVIYSAIYISWAVFCSLNSTSCVTCGFFFVDSFMVHCSFGKRVQEKYPSWKSSNIGFLGVFFGPWDDHNNMENTLGGHKCQPWHTGHFFFWLRELNILIPGVLRFAWNTRWYSTWKLLDSAPRVIFKIFVEA